MGPDLAHREVLAAPELRARDPGPFNSRCSPNGAARPSTSMFDTALAAARSKMISSFVTRG